LSKSTGRLAGSLHGGHLEGTGATGYIGGSVAEKLTAVGHAVTGLIRSEEKIALLNARGIEAVVGTLDDPDILAAAAQAADAVIHAANVDHATSVVTLVTTLERSGKLLIHTSGSSIVTDHADGEYAAQKPLTEDDYFEPVPYRRPRVDMNRYVRQAAIGRVRSIGYLSGNDLRHRSRPTAQQRPDPEMIALSRQIGVSAYFGEGLNLYSNVHIDDLIDLYLHVLEKRPEARSSSPRTDATPSKRSPR
jgi:nucleoside-diphosphate-sugar epimerase